MQFDIDTLSLIQKACSGKDQLKLTVGMLDHGKRTIRTFGGSGEIENENSIYQIGSISKTFTALLLSKYVSEQKLALGDPINQHIAGLDESLYYPPLYRLATHTAGYSAALPLNRREYLRLASLVLTGRDSSPMLGYFNDERMREILQKGNLQDRDYKWNYANFGFQLIGCALASVAKTSYDEVMNDFIAHDLGLSNTYVSTTERNLLGFNSRHEPLAHWDWNGNLGAPAGGISSCVDDLLAYAETNIHESRPYISLAHQKLADGAKGYCMGLGWWLMKDDLHTIAHGGSVSSFESALIIDKRQERAVVVMSNYRLGRNRDQKIAQLLLKATA